jgi:NAD(P)-dependent dehydrogenase (short-subunit alcohol dehydrogenase family)
MKAFSLENKTVLITGASSGIGKATAIAASNAGANVIITARDKNRLQDTFACLAPGEHKVIQADLSSLHELESLIDSFDNIDGLVHSAGVLKPFPIKFLAEKHFTEISRINYEAPVLLTASLLKKKKINDHGSVVFISSISSQYGYKGGALYSATKAAIDSFSRTLALEHASQKIRSNTINAGMVRTKIFEQASEIITSDLMDAHGKNYPLGFGEPEDIANAVLFLLSPASRWITGTSIVMDGGLTAGS